MPKTTNRVLYLQNGPGEKPSVRISKTSDGIMWSITATGRSLNLARVRAEKCYRALTDFAAEMERRGRQKIDDEIARRGKSARVHLAEEIEKA